MDLATVLETWGEPTVLALGGAAVGMLFGFSAQRSRFCLRAAVIEFGHRRFGDKLAVWLLAFSTAVVVVQALILLHQLDVSTARQLSTRGSLSGALIGGLLFGCGMVMTRGCASRLLVLSANGNLRALLSGLVFAAAAHSPLQARCVPIARMGCVVFHYDMLGYADSVQIGMEVAHSFKIQRPAAAVIGAWLNCSGAMKSGVPAIVCCVVWSARSFTSPKSSSTTLPSVVTSTLNGLMSLCNRSRWCNASTPSASCSNASLKIRTSGIFLLLRT